MQNYQQIKWSRSYGGAKHVFTGTETGVSCGLYEVDYNTVPNYLYGMVPAGTPVYADDAKKKAADDFLAYVTSDDAKKIFDSYYFDTNVE